MEKTLSFSFEKDTKNTRRYQEQVVGDTRPVIGTIYVLKSVAGSADSLTVTIKAG
jgi:hypothetical protein